MASRLNQWLSLGRLTARSCQWVYVGLDGLLSKSQRFGEMKFIAREQSWSSHESKKDIILTMKQFPNDNDMLYTSDISTSWWSMFFFLDVRTISFLSLQNSHLKVIISTETITLAMEPSTPPGASDDVIYPSPTPNIQSPQEKPSTSAHQLT